MLSMNCCLSWSLVPLIMLCQCLCDQTKDIMFGVFFSLGLGTFPWVLLQFLSFPLCPVFMVYLTFYLNEKLFTGVNPHLPSDDHRAKTSQSTTVLHANIHLCLQNFIFLFALHRRQIHQQGKSYFLFCKELADRDPHFSVQIFLSCTAFAFWLFMPQQDLLANRFL